MVLKKLKLFCVLTFVASGIAVVKCEPKVKLLHVLFRHGEKVPHKEFQNYPNDPHKNNIFYPLGSGGLTNEGKMREYKIGQMLRQRYGKFLGPTYWPDAIYARSTDVPRAQMSLQLVLAALFPPVGDQVWNKNLTWQPVTTIYEAYERDRLLSPQSCALYKVEFKKFINDEKTRLMVNRCNRTFDYLTKHSGKPVNTTSAVYYLYNLFKEEKMQNLSLPDWVSEVYPQPMGNITIFEFDLQSYTTKLKRLGGGTLLRKITDDIKDLKAKSLCPSDRKVFLFSGHETNVARLSRALGTNEPKLPAYGSTIIIETLQDDEKNDEYFVRVLLWTGVTEKLITQKIPGCSEICPLKEFLQLLKDVIPDDDEYQCCSKSKNSKKNSATSLSTNYISLIIAYSFVIVGGLSYGLKY